jgi:hypothetical protein
MPTLNAYVVPPDGQRFLVATRAADPEVHPIHIAVVDWSAIRPH